MWVQWRQCNTILEVRKKALGNFMNNANTARTSANTANKLPRQARVSNHDHHEQTAVSVLFCFVLFCFVLFCLRACRRSGCGSSASGSATAACRRFALKCIAAPLPRAAASSGAAAAAESRRRCGPSPAWHRNAGDERGRIADGVRKRRFCSISN